MWLAQSAPLRAMMVRAACVKREATSCRLRAELAFAGPALPAARLCKAERKVSTLASCQQHGAPCTCPAARSRLFPSHAFGIRIVLRLEHKKACARVLDASCKTRCVALRKKLKHHSAHPTTSLKAPETLLKRPADTETSSKQPPETWRPTCRRARRR